jgi:acetyl-CoA carboxylase biotin carboxyl carrier protein
MTEGTQPMSVAKKKAGDADLDLVRELANLLSEAGLSEIEYASGEVRVRVARAVPAAAAGAGPAASAAVAPSAAASTAGVRESDALLDHPGLLTSPMVGVAYTAADPGSPPFVKVGDAVEAGATLLLIEAMKVFNPIKAPRAGVVTRMLVSNGTPVEYGEPLLILE